MTWEDGHEVDYYFDVISGLIIKHCELDETGRIHTSAYQDYRQAGDILLPFLWINIGPLRDNPQGIIEEKVLDIQLNAFLDDDFFRPPPPRPIVRSSARWRQINNESWSLRIENAYEGRSGVGRMVYDTETVSHLPGCSATVTPCRQGQELQVFHIDRPGDLCRTFPGGIFNLINHPIQSV